MCFHALGQNSGYVGKVQRMANTIVQSNCFHFETCIQQSADCKPILVVSMWKWEVCFASGCPRYEFGGKHAEGMRKKGEIHGFRFDTVGECSWLFKDAVFLSSWTMPFFFFVPLFDNIGWHITTSLATFSIHISVHQLSLGTAYKLNHSIWVGGKRNIIPLEWT